MSGVPDPLYVRARKAFLDAADALATHRDSVVLVGAQAIYVHTGDADLADSTFGSVPEYTTDADFSLNPMALGDSPLVAELMMAGGFSAGEHPGEWHSADGVRVDLMVPEALAGAGSRGARLGPHGKRVARRAKGLEGALVDRDRRTLVSLDPADDRSVAMNVAGPGALLVAKIHKIAERAEAPGRIEDKDALDVFRLLRAIDTADLAGRIALLARSEPCATVTAEALDHLPRLFSRAESAGTEMAVRAAGVNADAEVIAASMTVLVSDLLATVGELGGETLGHDPGFALG